MKKQILASIIINFLSYFSGEAISGENKKLNKENHGIERVVTSSILPFDIGAEKLPPNYKGADVSRLYSLLVKKAPKGKSEFETKEEYEKRISEITFEDIYALKIEEAYDLRGLTISTYDAELQVFNIALRAEPLSEYTSNDYRSSLIIRAMNRKSHPYIGSNPYGATFEVRDFTATQYGVAFVNQDAFGVSGYDNKYNSDTTWTSRRNLDLVIKASPDKAKVLKGNIGVLLLCKPALYKSGIESYQSYKSYRGMGNSLTFEKSDSLKATIDNLESHYYERKYFNVEVLGVWVYDIRTGEVLFR
jgi:hypothetical protein